MARSTFRRFAGAAGLAGLLILLLAGVAEAACGDCSAHEDVPSAIEAQLEGHAGHDAHVPMEGHPPCCDVGEMDEGKTPDLPVCPHSVAATGCSGAGSLPSFAATSPNDGPRADLGIPAVADLSVSAVTAPPFQPPRA